MSTTSNSTYHKNINFEEFFPIFSVHKAKHHSSHLRVTFAQIFFSIRECHVVFFINSSKVRVKFRGSGAYPNLAGLEGLLGEKVGQALVAAEQASRVGEVGRGEAAVPPTTKQWGKTVGRDKDGA